MSMRTVFVLFLWTTVSCAGAFSFPAAMPGFVPRNTLASATRLPPKYYKISPLFLSSSSSDDSTTSKSRRKRVRRKDEPENTVKEASAVAENASVTKEPSVEKKASPLELKPRAAAPVELSIRDVRDVVSGKSRKDNDNDDDEYSTEDKGDTSGGDNALDQVLRDAREMRLDTDDDQQQEGVRQQALNVLSTIVTVDFFVVCALLVWFLAGIFCSYVLKDDAVQIAFNGIFQPVVQPALGVLMIASAAGAIFKSDEDE